MIGARRLGSRTSAAHAQVWTWQQRSAAMAQMMRPTNALPAAALVVLGARLLDTDPIPASVWQAAAAMACITAFGYISNDLADLAEDAINKPYRPLPSGRVSVAQAQGLAGCLALLGLVGAASVSLAALGIAAIVLALLTLYNAHLKATPGYGNLLIGCLAGAALLTGGVAAQGWPWPRLVALASPALTLALFVMAREVLKTLEDLPGDRAVGKQTFTQRHGARAVPALLMLLAWAVTFAAASALRLNYSWGYVMVVTLGVVLPLHAAAFDLSHHPELTRARRWLIVLKGSYAAGLIALFIA